MLICLSGLPGTGKTTIAQELARGLSAVYLEVDRIELAMRSAGWPVEDEGYGVAQAVAEDNIRLGRTVVVDSVSPWPVTRRGWQAVAERTEVAIVEVEIVCTDLSEHRRRMSRRDISVEGGVSSWDRVVNCDYRAWDSPRLVVDTARMSVDRCVCAILERAFPGQPPVGNGSAVRPEGPPSG